MDYDYEIVQYVYVNELGHHTVSTPKTRIMYEKGVKTSDAIWVGGNKRGDTQTLFKDRFDNTVKDGFYMYSRDTQSGNQGPALKSDGNPEGVDVTDLVGLLGGFSPKNANLFDKLVNIKEAINRVDMLIEQYNNYQEENSNDETAASPTDPIQPDSADFTYPNSSTPEGNLTLRQPKDSNGKPASAGERVIKQ